MDFDRLMSLTPNDARADFRSGRIGRNELECVLTAWAFMSRVSDDSIEWGIEKAHAEALEMNHGI
jgi:hypothetical protein